MRSTMQLIRQRSAPLLFGMLMLAACSESTSVSTPLEIQITTPTSAVTVLVGDTVALTAVATDPRDGPLTGSAIVWSAGSEASFATGTDVYWRAPSVGTFVVRARATGSAAAQATDSIRVTVSANSAPSISDATLSPAVRVYATDTVILTMTATDAESGALKGNRVQWVSTLDGPLGTGDTLAVPSRRLRAGVHTLVGYARDPQGFQDSTVFTLTVDSTSSRILWTRRFLGSVNFTLLTLANDGSLRFATNSPIAGCGGFCLVAVAADGHTLWNVGGFGQIDSHSGGMTIDPDGTTFVMDYPGNAKAVEANGTVRWSKKLSGTDPHGRFALAPSGALYMTGNAFDTLAGSGTRGGMLSRIDPATGQYLWVINPRTSGAFHSFGAYVNPLGQPVGSPDGFLLWATPTGDIIRTDTINRSWLSMHRSAMGADGSFYVPFGESQTRALAPDGALRWTSLPYANQSTASEAVVDANNVVYVAVSVIGSSDGFVQAFNGTDGTVLWTTPLPSYGGAFRRSYIALTNDGGMVVGVSNGVHSLSSTGAMRWSVPLMSTVDANIVIGTDATIYLLTGDARLMAIRGDAPLSTTAPWATYRADNRGTSSVLK